MTVPIFRKINIEVYKPGKSNLSKNKGVIKLSANESALGLSPKVKNSISEVETIILLNNLIHEIDHNKSREDS